MTKKQIKKNIELTQEEILDNERIWKEPNPEKSMYAGKKILTRRVWYIDVGQMPPHRANEHIERIKNEMSKTCSNLESPIVYEDYFFAVGTHGDEERRGSRVEFHDVRLGKGE
jgi:hypothetical protein